MVKCPIVGKRFYIIERTATMIMKETDRLEIVKKCISIDLLQSVGASYLCLSER